GVGEPGIRPVGRARGARGVGRPPNPGRVGPHSLNDVMADQHPHPLPRADWLALAREEPLLPGQAIVDAHHHLWHKPNDPYTARELLADAAEGHRIVATIFVEGDTGYRAGGPEAMRPVGETEMAVGEAGTRGTATDVARGIVSFVDLTLGEAVGPVLD